MNSEPRGGVATPRGVQLKDNLRRFCTCFFWFSMVVSVLSFFLLLYIVIWWWHFLHKVIPLSRLKRIFG